MTTAMTPTMTDQMGLVSTPGSIAPGQLTVRAKTPDETSIWAALAEVMDPEIPVISVVDLGIAHEVQVGPDGIRVTILPTFVGCPALEIIKSAITERLAAFGAPVEVVVSYSPPWTSERITATGRELLRQSGFAPPGSPALIGLSPRVKATCPYCGSNHTVLENTFGPTACRAIHHCLDCRQPFEQFKAV
jgi:ring-1,2-phenylacetyl-CoA epoxidase subunit PaaD